MKGFKTVICHCLSANHLLQSDRIKIIFSPKFSSIIDLLDISSIFRNSNCLVNNALPPISFVWKPLHSKKI